MRGSRCKLPLAFMCFLSCSTLAAMPVRLELTPTVRNGQIEISGRTNLPDGTFLIISVYRSQTHYSADGKVVVEGGAFKAGPYSDKGRSLTSGKYLVVASTPAWDVQPPAAKVPLGARYSNFTGPLVKKTEFGTIIEYKTSVTVAGKEDAAADASARKARDSESYERMRNDCYTIPDAAARLTHQALTDDKRQTLIAECLAEIEADRQIRR